MNHNIQQLKELKKYKDEIIRKVRGIDIIGVTTSQAQNLREYACRTDSVEEIILYLDYQCVRDKKLRAAGENLKRLIEKYKANGIHVIRYLLGAFARWVIIEVRSGEVK